MPRQQLHDSRQLQIVVPSVRRRQKMMAMGLLFFLGFTFLEMGLVTIDHRAAWLKALGTISLYAISMIICLGRCYFRSQGRNPELCDAWQALGGGFWVCGHFLVGALFVASAPAFAGSTDMYVILALIMPWFLGASTAVIFT